MITTKNKEITIGFEDIAQMNNWHMHIGSYNEGLILDDINEAIRNIENIIYDEYEIIYSSLLGYSIYDEERKKRGREIGEEIKINKWSSW